MKLNKLDLAILIIPLVIAAVSLFFLPDRIPVHWGENGPDSYGSKYLMLIFALLPFAAYKIIRRRLWPWS